MDKEVKFSKDLYNILMDIGSFRAFCDLKRNHSKLLYSNFVSSLNELKEQAIDRLFNLYGYSYKFDRRLIMTDGLGRKVEDILDSDDKYQAREIVNIARDEFDIDIPFLGFSQEIQEAIDASNKELSVMLLEGNMAQIYLPSTITKEMLDEVISEIENRDDYVFFIVRDNMATEELLKEEVEDYLNSLYELENNVEDNTDDLIEDNTDDLIEDNTDDLVEDNTDDVIEESNNKKEDYIRELILYTLDNKISVYDYYHKLGEKYRNSQIVDVTEFEKYNPFLTADDILKLIESDDDNIIDFFAESMNRVIMHDFNGEDYEDEFLNNFNDNLNEDENIGQVTSINLDLLYSADGFVLVNEKKVGTLSVYGYEANNPDEVKGKTTYENVPGYIESGFYINFMEFEENLRNQYNNQELSFITVDGEELEYDIVMDAALELSRQNGAIRLGREFKEKEINSVNDLKDLYTGEQASYKGTILNKGMFVSRDILYDFFSRLQVKVKGHEILQDEDSLDNEDVNLEYVR